MISAITKGISNKFMTHINVINNVQENSKYISHRLHRLEEGFRAVSKAYDEHIFDKNSFTNIVRLNDNISYRLFAALAQYNTFIRGLEIAETEILSTQQFAESSGITYGSQTFAERENEIKLSSYYDNIIFNLVSAFDYTAQLASYCLYKNADRTFDWDKLVKKLKTDQKMKNLQIAKVFDLVNKEFVQVLIDYRSRLIHRKRDKHRLTYKINKETNRCKVMIITSDLATKQLKNFLYANKRDYTNTFCSLNYTISVVLRNSLDKMEDVLDSLYKTILENSGWPHSAYNELSDTIFIHHNEETGMGEPVSKKMWRDFKSKK